MVPAFQSDKIQSAVSYSPSYKGEGSCVVGDLLSVFGGPKL
jgi:hypothetical protein